MKEIDYHHFAIPLSGRDRAIIATIIKNHLQEPRVPTTNLTIEQLLDEKSNPYLQGEKIITYREELGLHLLPASESKRQQAEAPAAAREQLAIQMGEKYGEYMEEAFRAYFSLEQQHPPDLSVENIRAFFKENIILSKAKILPEPQEVLNEYKDQLKKQSPEDESYASVQMTDYAREPLRDLRTGVAGSSGTLPNEEVNRAPLLQKSHLYVLGERTRRRLTDDPNVGGAAILARRAPSGIYDWTRFAIKINGREFKPSGKDLNEETFALEISTLLGREAPTSLLEELKLLMSTNGRTAGFASGSDLKTGMNLGTKDISKGTLVQK